MRYDSSHPDPQVELGRRLGDLKDRTLRADQRAGRSHVQTARVDNPAPSTTSTTPVAIYALTAVGDITGQLCVTVDTILAAGTLGMIGIADGLGDLVLSVPLGWLDVGRLTLGPVDIGLNDLSLVIAVTSGPGPVSARLIAAWVPDM